MKSWKNIPDKSHFSIYNLPFGIFSTVRRTHRVGVAIGKEIIDLAALCSIGLLDDIDLGSSVFFQKYLNEFIALGKPITNAVRMKLQELLCKEDSPLKDHPSLFVQQANATMHLPLKVGDYTDFYSSKEHATNVGKMFRDPENALLPNWTHMPVAYHGRSSSIVVSGTEIIRPKGQLKPATGAPVFSASQRMDFELEMAFVIGKDSVQGNNISTDAAGDYIFGLVLFNDWSARDIQKWEYVPLGPFLGKNFASSISPWIVTWEALHPFRVPGPVQNPPVLPYLSYDGAQNYDIDLSVTLTTQEGVDSVISRSNSKYLYWNMPQQLAHHTINGCNVNTGDLMASGTISGHESTSYGSLLELSWGGKQPVKLTDGNTRTFLEDYDSITLEGYAAQGNVKVGFGEVTGRLLPSS